MFKTIAAVTIAVCANAIALKSHPKDDTVKAAHTDNTPVKSKDSAIVSKPEQKKEEKAIKAIAKENKKAEKKVVAKQDVKKSEAKKPEAKKADTKK